MAKYYYNGVLLPEIPADVLAEYPYAVITRMDSYSRYNVYLSAGAWYLSGNDIKNDVTESEPICRLEDGKSEWTQISPADYVIFIPTNAVVWSNHDIPNGSATATEIYFSGSDPVPEETEEPETVTQYLIREDSLIAIGDGFRSSRGTTKKYTLDEMAAMAAEPVPTPKIEPLIVTENGTYDIADYVDGYGPVTVKVASSGGASMFASNASGRIPEYEHGTALSVLSLSDLNFESSAVSAV